MNVDLARAQFALTSIYHFLFVPVTMGLSVLVAVMQTLWHRSGVQAWRRLTRFFGTLLLINVAVGVVTGLVQEFEFGMNWSAYSRYVGDIFGAPLAAKFMDSSDKVEALGATLTDVRVVTAVMIVLMSFSQFYTQRQLMTKNVDTTVKTPFMQQQKMLMYVFPVMFAVFGVNFPVGVLVYWLTTNVWTMGQQMYVIRNNPTPGSKWTASDPEDEREFVRRLEAKGIPTTVRDTRGSDIDGACGQLSASEA